MDNQSLTHSANYQFILSHPETNNITFFVQGFTGLGFQFQEVNTPWFGQNVKRPGDVINFNNITLEVVMDEKFKALEDIHTIMKKSRDIYNGKNKIDWNNSYTGILNLISSKNNPVLQITFDKCWILDISDLTFDSKINEDQPVITTISLVHDGYEIKRF